jgi:hypothetical protein
MFSGEGFSKMSSTTRMAERRRVSMRFSTERPEESLGFRSRLSA